MKNVINENNYFNRSKNSCKDDHCSYPSLGTPHIFLNNMIIKIIIITSTSIIISNMIYEKIDISHF